MSQLFQSTMKESNPKLTPELFDHNSASEAAIEILKNSLGRQTIWEPDMIQFLNKPNLKQLINGG